ncbi:MAG: glycosyltransferase family 4 protein, partial [Chloroflexota bacterium]
DVLHAMWADEPGFIAVVAAKFLRVRAVVSLMGGELVHLPEIGYGHQQSYSARWLITRALKHADVVTVGSQTLMARAEHSPGAGKLAYAPLGVDTTLFMPQGEAEPLAGAVCLLHVASLVPIKHQALLLEAFASVEVPDVHLHIVGDGVLYGQLQEMASRMRITERVHFHRHVRHEQLAAFYRAAHLCLLTSHYESQSMVALEAAACGKATIGTDVGLLRELVDDEWLTDDADRLAAFIKRLIRDETLRGNLQDRAHLEAVQVFSLERGVERWLALYRNQSVPKWN